MPQLPRYQSQVSPANLPSVRNEVTQVGSPELAQGLQSVASFATKIAERETEKADNAMLLEADIQLSTLEQKMFHEGAFQSKGKDAIGAAGKVFPQWNAAVSEISGNLSPRVQQRFQWQAGRRTQALQETLSRHTLNESDKYQKSVWDGFLGSTAKEASLYYNDPEKIDELVAKAHIAGEATGQYEGLALSSWQPEVESMIRSGAVIAMIDDDPISAQKYLNDNRSKFTAEAYATFDKQLNPLVDDQKAQEKAMELLKGGDFLGAMKKASEEKDPDVRKLVLGHISLQKSIFDAQKEKHKEDMGKQLSTLVEGVDPEKPLRETLPPDAYTFAVENGLMNALESRVKNRIEGKRQVTDPVRYEGIQSLLVGAANGDPEAIKSLKAENPVMWKEFMDPGDWDRTASNRLAILNPTESEQSKVYEIVATDAELNTYAWAPLGINGMNDTDDKQPKAELKSSFRRAYDAEVLAQQNKHGRPLVAQERQTIMKDLTMTFVKKNRWLPDETFKTLDIINTIPATEKLAIQKAYMDEHGREPSTMEIVSEYAQMHQLSLQQDASGS